MRVRINEFEFIEFQLPEEINSQQFDSFTRRVNQLHKFVMSSSGLNSNIDTTKRTSPGTYGTYNFVIGNKEIAEKVVQIYKTLPPGQRVEAFRELSKSLGQDVPMQSIESFTSLVNRCRAKFDL